MVAIAPSPAPRTQVSLVPPMPDNDPPIAPPTAQVLRGRAAPSPDASNLFPRPETPLAPPPSPVPPPPRSRREGQAPPRPLRDSQTPPTTPPPRDPQPARAARRAAVPMPDRSGRSAQESRPHASARPPSPRPTISTPVVPPPAFAPAIPAMPPLPTVPAIPDSQRLPENEVTLTAADPTDRLAEDLDHPTIARVPIEITENISNTTISPQMPMPEDADAEDTARPHDLADDVSRDGDAASVPARGADGWLPVPTTLAGAVPPVPLVRDRAKLPITTAPTSLPPPRDSKQTFGPSPACPQCESPMTWIEEHLRFYCKSCRMYF